jgi:hypothetical protein
MAESRVVHEHSEILQICAHVYHVPVSPGTSLSELRVGPNLPEAMNHYLSLYSSNIIQLTGGLPPSNVHSHPSSSTFQNA